MLKKSHLIYLFVLILSINNLFSSTYISEIDFQDNEFVEIYSTNILNLTNKLIHDDKGIDYANTLELIQKKDSPFYLITGSNFIENNNL